MIQTILISIIIVLWLRILYRPMVYLLCILLMWHFNTETGKNKQDLEEQGIEIIEFDELKKRRGEDKR